MEYMHQKLDVQTASRIDYRTVDGVQNRYILNKNIPNYNGDEPYGIAYIETPQYNNAPKQTKFIKYEDLDKYKELVKKYNEEDKVANQFISPYISGKHNLATLKNGLLKDLERLQRMNIQVIKEEPIIEIPKQDMPIPEQMTIEEQLQKNIDKYIEARNAITQLMKERSLYSREEFNETYNQLKNEFEEIKRELNPEGLINSPNLARAEAAYKGQFNHDRSIQVNNSTNKNLYADMTDEEIKAEIEKIIKMDRDAREHLTPEQVTELRRREEDLEDELERRKTNQRTAQIPTSIKKSKKVEIKPKDPKDMTDEEIKAEIEKIIKMDRDAREHLTPEQVTELRRREEELEDELERRKGKYHPPTPPTLGELRVEKRSAWQWVKDHKKQILIVAGLSAIAVATIVALQGLIPAITASMQANSVSSMCQAMLTNAANWHTAVASEQAALHGANTGLASLIETLTGNKATYEVASGIWRFGQSSMELNAFAKEAAITAAKAAKTVTNLSRTAGLLSISGLGSIGLGSLSNGRSNNYGKYKETIKTFTEQLKNNEVDNEFYKNVVELAAQINNDNSLTESEKRNLLRKITKLYDKAEETNQRNEKGRH